jgi:hypothetical protein
MNFRQLIHGCLQGSGGVKKFYVEANHPTLEESPTSVVAFDRDVKVEQKQWWGFCAGGSNAPPIGSVPWSSLGRP